MKTKANTSCKKKLRDIFYRKLFPFVSETLNVFVPPIQVRIEIGIDRCFSDLEDYIVKGGGFEARNVTTSG